MTRGFSAVTVVLTAHGGSAPHHFAPKTTDKNGTEYKQEGGTSISPSSFSFTFIPIVEGVYTVHVDDFSADYTNLQGSNDATVTIGFNIK